MDWDDDEMQSPCRNAHSSTTEQDTEEYKNAILYRNWIDLSPYTKKNLKKFESPTFHLPEVAVGIENVKELVNKTVDHFGA